MGIIIVALLALMIISAIFGIIRGVFRGALSVVLFIIIGGLAGYAYLNDIHDPIALVSSIVTKFENEDNQQVPAQPNQNQPTQQSTNTQPAPQSTDSNQYFVPKLNGNEKSSTDSNGNPLGAAKWGATFIVGDTDDLNRPTFSHILVSDSQEPGQNGEKRSERISVNPAGWRNYKLGSNFANDRTHMVGYQFCGVNDEYRNLVTATAYLNRGTDKRGMNPQNPDGMLYYEQQLDSWLSTHPNYKLDYYVKPLYDGNGKVLKTMYMQWVGVDDKGDTIAINVGGKSQPTNTDYYYVLLDNASPSYNINYQTGQVAAK